MDLKKQRKIEVEVGDSKFTFKFYDGETSVSVVVVKKEELFYVEDSTQIYFCFFSV